MFLLNYLQIINNLAKSLFQQQQKVVMMNIFFTGTYLIPYPFLSTMAKEKCLVFIQYI